MKIDTLPTLCTEPLWRPEDLGKPIPDSPHAVSVALPLWEHVIGYEERDPAVVNAMKGGYPRFFLHPLTVQLFRLCEARFARSGEKCLAFPSEKSARHCVAFLKQYKGVASRVDPLHAHAIHVVTLAEGAFDDAKKYWQHFGEIVSSRQAQAVLEGREAPAALEVRRADLRDRIGTFAGVAPRDIYLYPSGMAALGGALRLVQQRTPGEAHTVQLGFPYVDLLQIQRYAHGCGPVFTPTVDGCAMDATLATLETKAISAVFCELPSNPLLQSSDIPRLSAACRKRRVPLVVDETIASFYNVDLRDYADVIVTSLTKYFSGVGDVMGGSLILNARGPLYDVLKATLDTQHEDLLWVEDAAVLEANARDFPRRMARINATAERVCDFLREDPRIESVHYPKFSTPENYRHCLRPEGGYGGLFSVVVKGGEDCARAFYDNLRVSKGPSLGTNYTLACPFILLAHYDELDWVESLGIPIHLVRVGIGLEEPEDLIERFREALGRSTA